MSTRTPAAAAPWWQRRAPSLLILAVLLTGILVAVVVVGRDVSQVLPEVPKDQLGEDRWEAPLGIELGSMALMAYVPECAAGSITRIALWDQDSNPYWEVAGPPTPMTQFVIGLEPTGFTTVTPYRAPPRGAVLRLVAFRRVGGPLGLRYHERDLVKNRVMGGKPLSRFSIDGWKTAAVCSSGSKSDSTDLSTPG